MNSVAIITRAYDAEAPYIHSFHEYYTSLGVNEFHIVVPCDNPCEFLKAACEGIDNVQLHFQERSTNSIHGAQNYALPFVSASHILSVDVDEYLYTDNIEALLTHDYVRFFWVIAPYSQLPSDTTCAFKDKQCKYLVRKSICNHLGEHDCQVSTPVTVYTSTVPLIHYVYRSYFDLILKCTLSNYGDYQATLSEQLTEGINDCKQLPLKFKMLAIYRRMADASIPYTVPNFVKINVALEAEIISNTPYPELLPGLSHSLSQYSSRLNLKKFIKQIKQSNEFKKMKRLPHFVLAEIADTCLDDAFIVEDLTLKKERNIVSRLFDKII